MSDPDNFIGTLAEARSYIKLICAENRELDREVQRWHSLHHPSLTLNCSECDRR